MFSGLGAEHVAVVAAIDPDAYTAETYVSGWIDMSQWDQLIGIVLAGDLGTNATVDAKWQQSAAAAGTSPKDVTARAITQMTQAGTNMSNKIRVVNLHQGDMDAAGGFRYAQFSITVGTATSDAAGVVLGVGGRRRPVSQIDSANVTQIVPA